MGNIQEQRRAIETVLNNLDEESIVPIGIGDLSGLFLPNGRALYPAGVSVARGGSNKRTERVLVLVGRPVLERSELDSLPKHDQAVHKTVLKVGDRAMEAVQVVEVIGRTDNGVCLAPVGTPEVYCST